MNPTGRLAGQALLAVAALCPPALANDAVAWQLPWQEPAEWKPQEQLHLNFARAIDLGEGLIGISDGPRTRVYKAASGEVVKDVALPAELDAARGAYTGRYFLAAREAKGDGDDDLELWDLAQGKRVGAVKGGGETWKLLGDQLATVVGTDLVVYRVGKTLEKRFSRKAKIKVEQKQGPVSVSFDNRIGRLHLTAAGVFGELDPRFTDYHPVLFVPWKGGEGRMLKPPRPAWHQDGNALRTAGPGIIVHVNTNSGKAPYRLQAWDVASEKVLYDLELPAGGFDPRGTDLFMHPSPWFEDAVYFPFIEDTGQKVPDLRKARVLDLRSGKWAAEMNVWMAAPMVFASGSCLWFTASDDDKEAVLHELAMDGSQTERLRFPLEDWSWRGFRTNGKLIACERVIQGRQQILRIDPAGGPPRMLLERPSGSEGHKLTLDLRGVMEDGTAVVVEESDDKPVRVYGLKPRS